MKLVSAHFDDDDDNVTVDEFQENLLEEELDDGQYSIEGVDASDFVEDGEIDATADVFVVDSFVETDSTDAETFINNISEETGVIYLDQWTDRANSVEALEEVRGDPESTEDTFESDATATLVITEDHPLFDNVGEEGDVIQYFTDASFTDRLWFEDYDGEVLGEIGDGSATELDDFDGPAVGVNDDKNEVLLSTSSRANAFVAHDEYTEEENTLVINAIEYVAE